jgi:hypothetical protein
MDPLLTTISELVVRVGVPVTMAILFMIIVWGWNTYARTKVEQHLVNQSAIMTKMCDTTESMANSVEIVCKVLDKLCVTVDHIEDLAMVSEALRKAGGQLNEITP